MTRPPTPFRVLALPWAGVVVSVVALATAHTAGMQTVAITALGLVGVGMSLAMVMMSQRSAVTETQRDKAVEVADALAVELQGHKDALDDLAEGLDVGIFLVDPKTKIEYANPKAVSLFEFDEPEGQTLLAVTLSSTVVELVERVASSGEAAKDEIVFEHPSERIMAVVAWQESTAVKRIFVSLYDITHLRRLERVRRDFVANVSHELRTPLTTIRAMAETLIDDPDDAELRHKYEARIVAEVDRLTRVAEDLLTLSALEAGQAVKSDVDLAEIVRNVVNQTQAKAAKKGLNLTIHAPQSLPVRANEHQMNQVALNLIDNAVNYTQEGSVDVDLSLEGDHAVLEVKDTGIGVAVDHQPRIFERFYRVDRGRSRETGGTGLGLSIVRNIVEGHGGKVTVSSRLGHGSTFRVYLPLV
ncbi:MAG: PAS domain-containing protein [Fimbriimonadaceae bacterium]|nr:PAS domain-containing protein [Fimbriimonadaceae bacterium]